MSSKILFGAILLCSAFLLACEPKTDITDANSSSSVEDQDKVSAETALNAKIKQGAYLVKIMGCSDCHTPLKMTAEGPAPDLDRFLSGHPSQISLPPVKDLSILKDYVLFNMTNTAVQGPWGTSYSANLTPDASGIGTWTEEQFSRAMREGKAKGLENGRFLLPPMPWQNFTDIKEEDLSAIFAYLRTIKPVQNLVPNPVPPAVVSMN